MHRLNILFAAVIVGLFLSPALALAYYYPYAPQTVTAPYWCGSYWASQPCGQWQGYSPNNNSWQYQYTNPYTYNPYTYQGYTSPYTTGYGSGYWGYCYETVAPNYGPSYRYPCFYPYQSNSYDYNSYYYNGYYPYQYNYMDLNNSTMLYYGTQW